MTDHDRKIHKLLQKIETYKPRTETEKLIVKKYMKQTITNLADESILMILDSIRDTIEVWTDKDMYEWRALRPLTDKGYQRLLALYDEMKDEMHLEVRHYA